MVYVYKETDPIDVTLLKDRIVGLYAVPLSKCWWDAGGVHAHDGDQSNRVYGVLSKESLKNLQFEMKGDISTDPLSDLLKPLVKSAEKWAQNKFQILRMLKGDNNSAAENVMAIINNLYMVGKVSAAKKENEESANTNESSGPEAVNFRAPVLQVPVYNAVPGVSLNLSSPITILFQYGFNATNINTIEELFDVKTCVLEKLSTVQKLLPKLTIKDREAGKSWETAAFTTTFPTQAHFISALFGTVGDVKDKGVALYREVLDKAKKLVAPSANDKSSVEQVYTQISSKLADNIKKIDSTIDKDLSTEDLMAYIYDKGDDYKGLSDYVPESFTNEKGDLPDDNARKSYFSYAREMFENFSSLSKATPKTYKNPINDPTNGFIFGIGAKDQVLEKISPSKLSKKLSDTDKLNIGNSPLYEYVNNQGSSKLTELLEDIVAVKDKISAAILDNLGGNALYLEAFGGNLIIGPFLAEQISWSYDMSVVDDEGYPLAGSVKIQKLVSILPGTGAVALNY